jgi:hypothetical protein
MGEAPMRVTSVTPEERRRLYLGIRQDNRIISLPHNRVYFVPGQKLMTPEEGDRALSIFRSELRPQIR